MSRDSYQTPSAVKKSTRRRDTICGTGRSGSTITSAPPKGAGPCRSHEAPNQRPHTIRLAAATVARRLRLVNKAYRGHSAPRRDGRAMCAEGKLERGVVELWIRL